MARIGRDGMELLVEGRQWLKEFCPDLGIAVSILIALSFSLKKSKDIVANWTFHFFFEISGSHLRKKPSGSQKFREVPGSVAGGRTSSSCASRGE